MTRPMHEYGSTEIAEMCRAPRTPEAVTFDEAARRAHVRPVESRWPSPLSLIWLALCGVMFALAGYAIAALGG